MQQIYLKRMTKQDITRSVTICTESVKTFWGVDPNMTNEANGKNCLNKAYEYRNNDIIKDIKLYSEKYFDICSYPQTYVLYKNEAAS